MKLSPKNNVQRHAAQHPIDRATLIPHVAKLQPWHCHSLERNSDQTIEAEKLPRPKQWLSSPGHGDGSPHGPKHPQPSGPELWAPPPDTEASIFRSRDGGEHEAECREPTCSPGATSRQPPYTPATEGPEEQDRPPWGTKNP